MKWERHGSAYLVLLYFLIAFGLLIVSISSCEIENGSMPCGTVIVIEWDVKSNPEKEVPIIDAMNHYEVKALLYDDSNESTLMKCVSVKTDTVMLDICDIDLTNYQNSKHLCEIYLIDFN